MRIKFIFFAVILFMFSACKTDSVSEESQEYKEAKLLFKSGFENGVYIDDTVYEDSEDSRFIRGKDNQTGFTWPINILGAKESALHYIDDNNQDAVFAQLQSVIGHDAKPTIALYQQENYEDGYTQCPYQINNIKDGTKDLYIKFWIKIDSDSLYQKDKWRTYFEWKSKDYAKGEGFRLISFIYTDDDGVPYWHFQGDRDPEHPIWEIDNKIVPVPADEWFMNEFYWHWSEGKDGLALWKINGETIAQHHGATTRNSKPIDFIILAQIYGDANPKHQWIDDIEIWDGIPK